MPVFSLKEGTVIVVEFRLLVDGITPTFNDARLSERSPIPAAVSVLQKMSQAVGRKNMRLVGFFTPEVEDKAREWADKNGFCPQIFSPDVRIVNDSGKRSEVYAELQPSFVIDSRLLVLQKIKSSRIRARILVSNDHNAKERRKSVGRDQIILVSGWSEVAKTFDLAEGT